MSSMQMYWRLPPVQLTQCSGCDDMKRSAAMRIEDEASEN